MKIEVTNAEQIRIQDAEDIYEIIQKVFYQKKNEVDLMKEHFWSFSLNKAAKILALELVSIGCKDRTIAEPGDVFRVPLYKSSSYVILVHNHPSGNLRPSDGDMDLTNRLIKAGEILNIPVFDHVIVTDKSFYSFRDNGLIEKLELDTKYALSYIYQKKMTKKMEQLKADIERQRKAIRSEGKKEGLQEGEERGKKEGLEEGAKKERIEIARQMLIKGMDTNTIQELTQLVPQQIGRLKNELERSLRDSLK